MQRAYVDSTGGGWARRLLIALVLAVLAVLLPGSVAMAADTCPESPDTWIQYGPESAEGEELCPCTPVDLGATWMMLCDLDPGLTADTSGGWIAAIYDPGYAGGGAVCGNKEYCAWGELPDSGGSFLCQWNHTTDFDSVTHNLVKITVHGSQMDDVISFQWDTYDLDTWAAETTLNATAKGRDETDHVFGSRRDGGYYLEALYGDDMPDLICSYDGPDETYGGAGNDVQCSAGGSDVNEGGTGDDQIDWGSTPGGGSDSTDGGPGSGDVCNTGSTNCESFWSSSPCAP